MPPFPFPVDQKSAERVLSRFSDFASNSTFLNVFLEAVLIIYGRNYVVKMDLTNRMAFSCCACNKTMNNTQSLNAHNLSANHLKNADHSSGFADDYVLNAKSLAKQYPPESLEYQLLVCNIKIVGLHLIEKYKLAGKYQVYYKCILCGAHGKTEAMYKHILGDKHTDRYIKFSVEVDLSSVSTDIRHQIRTKVMRRDGIDVKKIKTFTGRDLYPYMWEQEGLSKNALLSRYKNRMLGSVPSPDKRSEEKKHSWPHDKSSRPVSPASPSTNTRSFYVKQEQPGCSRDTRLYMDLETDGNVIPKKNIKTEKKILQTPRGVIIQRDTGVSTSTQKVQVCTPWAVDRCLLKLNFINHTRSLKCSGVYSQDDAKSCLEMMFSLGNLLYYTIMRKKNVCKSKDKLIKLSEASDKVLKMLGSVNFIMAERWNLENPGKDCLNATKALWEEDKNLNREKLVPYN